MDIFLLNYFVTDRADLGYYGLATIFIIGLGYITTTAQNIAAPYFSEKSGDRKEFVRVLWKYEKLIILVSLFVGAIAFVLVPKFIEIAYGPRYSSASLYFRILIIKYIFSSSYALLGIAIFGLGKMKYNFIASTAAIPATFCLTYLLINLYGTLGAAVAQAAAQFITLIIVAIITQKVLKERFD